MIWLNLTIETNEIQLCVGMDDIVLKYSYRFIFQKWNTWHEILFINVVTLDIIHIWIDIFVTFESSTYSVETPTQTTWLMKWTNSSECAYSIRIAFHINPAIFFLCVEVSMCFCLFFYVLRSNGVVNQHDIYICFGWQKMKTKKKKKKKILTGGLQRRFCKQLKEGFVLHLIILRRFL